MAEKLPFTKAAAAQFETSAAAPAKAMQPLRCRLPPVKAWDSARSSGQEARVCRPTRTAVGGGLRTIIREVFERKLRRSTRLEIRVKLSELYGERSNKAPGSPPSAFGPEQAAADAAQVAGTRWSSPVGGPAHHRVSSQPVNLHKDRRTRMETPEIQRGSHRHRNRRASGVPVRTRSPCVAGESLPSPVTSLPAQQADRQRFS